MLGVAESIVDEYCGTMQSRKRVLLQRAAASLASSERTTDAALFELEGLFEYLQSRGHELYRCGTDILRDNGLTSLERSFSERFAAMLCSLLADIVMFDLIAASYVAALRGVCVLSAETQRCYAHAALVMPTIKGGAVFTEFRRAMLSAQTL